MAVVQISKIQLRRGRKNSGTGLPQLASGEMAWAIDTQELYIGNGAVSEGSPAVGNTKVLTEHDNILDLLNQYEYRLGAIGTGLNGDVTTRTLQQRLDEGAVNAKSFGISTDDVTVDQTDLIQNAINQLFLLNTAKDAVTLEFDPGTYKLTGTVYIPPKVKVVGSGIDSTIFDFVRGGVNSKTTLALAGTSITTPGRYTNLAYPSISGGSGTGLVLSVEKAGQGTQYTTGNTTITIVNSGSGYQSGDQITVLGSALGGASPTNNLTITLSASAVNPTFGTTKVFEFVNSTGLSANRESTTNETTQSRNNMLKGFTVKTNANNIMAFDFYAVKDSVFEDIKAVGSYSAVALATPNADSVALKMSAKSDMISCERNRFKNFRVEGFSYGAYSVSEVFHNTFDSCVFRLSYEGIRFGDSTIIGSSGPYKNTITNCIFDTINKYGIVVDVGYGNKSRGNTFVNVGNDIGSYPVCGQIKFTQAGNSSVQDTFDRTKLTRTRLNDPSLTFYPEIEGHGSYTEFASATISLPSRTVPQPFLRIPLQATTGIEINYVFQSNTYPYMRKGTISIAVDRNNNNWQLVDDYEFVGTGGHETDLTFTTDLLHNALVILYTNTSAGDTDNTFTYTYTITS